MCILPLAFTGGGHAYSKKPKKMDFTKTCLTMKTHLKLTVILIVVIAVAFHIITKNNDGLRKTTKTFSMLKTTFSGNSGNHEVDSTTFKRLLPFFNIKKDEFDAHGILSYVPKDSPDRPKSNALYCHFEQVGDSVVNLRIRLQVENKEWLFFKHCQFLIDGNVYDYYPGNTEFNVGTPGNVCEWFDESVNENNIQIVKALSSAKEAKVRIIGRHYSKIVVFSKEQLQSINNTLALYIAMKGVV